MASKGRGHGRDGKSSVERVAGPLWLLRDMACLTLERMPLGHHEMTEVNSARLALPLAPARDPSPDRFMRPVAGERDACLYRYSSFHRSPPGCGCSCRTACRPVRYRWWCDTRAD